MRWDLAIDRGNIRKAEIVAASAGPIAEGEALFAIERFALTANNVTYAALGNPSGLFGNGLGYWDFFSPEDGSGRLPVWGFGRVLESRVDGIQVGQSYYGYFPMASHVVLRPEKVGAGGFADVSGRRATMPAVYNQYAAAPDGLSDRDRDLQALFRPLHLTGWLLADELADDGPEAGQILVSGASSKTAIGFAHAYRAQPGRSRLIGLTSARGRSSAEQAGVYDELVDYEDVSKLDRDETAVLIDIAGNGPVSGRLHDSLGERLVRHVVVGKAHWDAPVDGAKRRAVGFFAPARVAKRLADWGPAGFRERMEAETQRFLADVAPLYRIDHRHGPEAALLAYREVVEGRADPQSGVIILPTE